MIVIIPVLQRPHRLAPLLETWNRTTDAARLVLAADRDDPTLSEYREGLRGTGVELRVGEPLITAPKLNAVVREYQDQDRLIGFFGDDVAFRTPGWDTTLGDSLHGTGMAYPNDLFQGQNLPCHCVMTSDIPKTLGYMCFPGTKHLCIDVAWKHWGQGIDRLVYHKDVVVEHLHSANHKAVLDDTYRLGNSVVRVEEDGAAWRQYEANGLQSDIEKLKQLL